MERVHEILHNGMHEQIKEAFAAPKEHQRFLWYTNKIDKKYTYPIASYTEGDELLIYSETDIAIKMAPGGHLYPQRKFRKGFTLDKQKKKIRMWNGTHPTQLRWMRELLNELKKEWVVNEGFLSWLTGGLLEKILLDKITNPRDAVKYIIKANRIKGADPKLLREYIKHIGVKNDLLSWIGIVTDINVLLRGEAVPHLTSYYIRDMKKQARILGKQINLKWSPKRMKEVHKDWTREIMKLELDMIEPEMIHYKYHNEFLKLLPSNFELIRDRRRLFQEGTEMDHCVYTNYWDVVKARRYMVIHIEQDGELPVTAGIDINNYYSKQGFRLDQVHGLRNQVQPTEETSKQLHNLLNSAEFVVLMRREFYEDAENEEELVATPTGDYHLVPEPEAYPF